MVQISWIHLWRRVQIFYWKWRGKLALVWVTIFSWTLKRIKSVPVTVLDTSVCSALLDIRQKLSDIAADHQSWVAVVRRRWYTCSHANMIKLTRLTTNFKRTGKCDRNVTLSSANFCAFNGLCRIIHILWPGTAEQTIFVHITIARLTLIVENKFIFLAAQKSIVWCMWAWAKLNVSLNQVLVFSETFVSICQYWSWWASLRARYCLLGMVEYCAGLLNWDVNERTKNEENIF